MTTIVTHDGTFHADEVFAVAVLRRVLGDDVRVLRTRDRAALDAADYRVDVGFAHDPVSRDFDHHQRGGAGRRANGIPYASFGLVWQAFGARACGDDPQAAEEVERILVAPVDAQDTGVDLVASRIDGLREMTVSNVVAALNPRWNDPVDPADETARFEEAVAFAAGVLDREIAGVKADLQARRLVQEAVRAAADPRVIELEHNMPFKRAVHEASREALLVIYPKSSGWGVETVPVRLGSFDNRMDLPEAWAGLDGPELASLTGVEDAVFCHAARFLAVARSREGARELVRQALASGA